MNQRLTICGLAMLITCCAVAPGRGQDTQVFGDPEELAYEAHLRQVLSQPVTVNFDQTPLDSVAAHLEKLLGVEIIFDARALEDAGTGSDAEVTFACENLPAREMLKGLLDRVDLTWVSRQALHITTRGMADAALVIRVYPVADLVLTGDDEEASFDYESLIELITTTLSPTTWDEVGGAGSIAPLENAGALAFSQTREVHEQVLMLLWSLRRARDAQGLPVYDIKRGFENAQRRQAELARAYQSQSQAYEETVQPEPEPVAVHSWQLPRRHE